MRHIKLILAMAVLLANCFCVSAWETSGAGSQVSGTVDAQACGTRVIETATIQNNEKTISKTVEGNGYVELYLSTDNSPGIVPVNIVQTIPFPPQKTTENAENPIPMHPPTTISGQDTKQTQGFGLLITLLAILQS